MTTATLPKSIAIFDLSITARSPAGSCILQMLRHLSCDYRFVVFADKFENPNPERITWIRVPVPHRPVISRYILFKYLAPLYYRKFAKQHHQPDLIMATEGEFSECDICYVHFCHRAYLKKYLLKLSSLRSAVRFANHHFNAKTEAESLRQAKIIVVPSLGLASELTATYGSEIAGEIITIENPLDVAAFTRPDAYDSSDLRSRLGFADDDIVLAFAALGDFERKGLKILMRSLSNLFASPKASNLKLSNLKLLVIGGSDLEVSEYRTLSAQLNLSDRTSFVGFQSDIRPYLWLSSLFVLPSAYETFSLVVFQAAIAGLPIVATQLYGVETFLQSGENGWLIERSESSIEQALKAVVEQRSQLQSMGAKAHISAAQYDIPRFVERWRELLKGALNQDLDPIS